MVCIVKVLNNLQNMSAKQNKIFLYVVTFSYILTVALTYVRVYVYHAYPTYSSAEEIPALTSELFNVTNFLHQ